MRRHLDSLENRLAMSGSDIERFDLAVTLSKRFRSTNSDSALYYAHRASSIAVNLGENERKLSTICIVDGLAAAGLFTEAVALYDSLKPAALSPDVKLRYWTAGRRLYGYMKGYSQGNQKCYLKYDGLYQQFDDSLILHLPPGNEFREFLMCERLVTQKQYHEAEERLERLIKTLPSDNNLYGMAAYQMARVWLNLGNEEKYATWLAVSALSDVKGCVSEGMALPTLAEWLYRQGELNESFSFINFALEEATAGNARMRAVSIARFVPVIDDAYKDKINSSRDELMVYFLLVTLLLIATGSLIFVLIKQMKKTKASALKLSQTSRRQESYIGNFIGLYSIYADRLNHFTRLVSTKLATGQSAELKKLVDSGRFTDQDNDDIHKIFDAAFLDIYPDFVANINALLRPEEAIEVKTPGRLTPELRIYAFVKLGIDESTRIAQILHYSVNTVYTYRNKMRNKAHHRDSFDEEVKHL